MTHCKYHTHEEMREILTQLKNSPKSVQDLVITSLGATSIHEMAMTLTVNALLPTTKTVGASGGDYFWIVGDVPSYVRGFDVPYKVSEKLNLGEERYPVWDVSVENILAKHTEIFGERLPLWVGGDTHYAKIVSVNPFDRKRVENETWEQCAETFYWDVERRKVKATAYYDAPESAWTEIAKTVAPGCKIKPYLRINIESGHSREGFVVEQRYIKRQGFRSEILAVKWKHPLWNRITSHGGYCKTGPYPSDHQVFWR